jgi:predicted nucleic acid-binding protein
VYLIDSNILLELLLDQENAGDVERLLRGVPVETLYISGFSLYSVGIVLLRRGM